jgi:hypothetical protein
LADVAGGAGFVDGVDGGDFVDLGPDFGAVVFVVLVLSVDGDGEAEGRDVAAGLGVGDDLVVEGAEEDASFCAVEADGGANAFQFVVPVGSGGDAGEVPEGGALVPAEAEQFGVVDVVGEGGEEAAAYGVLQDVGGDEPVGVFAVVLADPAGGDEDGVIGAPVG